VAEADCYPPANLWYRIAAEFDGELEFRFLPGNHSITHCIPCRVGTTELDWKLRSNSAVRLRLMCDAEADEATARQRTRVHARAQLTDPFSYLASGAE
jgi:hypothetical protein